MRFRTLADEILAKGIRALAFGAKVVPLLVVVACSPKLSGPTLEQLQSDQGEAKKEEIVEDAVPERVAISGLEIIQAGQCAEYAISLRSEDGELAAAESAQTIGLSGGTGDFHSGASCAGAPIASVAIAAGQASETVYYRDELVETALLVADSLDGLADAQLTVTVDPGAADRFEIVDPANTTVTIATTVTIRVLDSYGNLVTSFNDDVTLVASGSVTGDGLVDIAGGVGSLSINDSVAENVTLSLSDSQLTGLDFTATQIVGFASSTPTQFVILDPTDSTAGTATTVTVQAQDGLGNVVTVYQNDVTLNAGGSATGDGLVSIVNGQGTLSINDTVAEAVALTLSDSQGTGLTVTSSQSVTFAVGAAAQVVFTTEPSTTGTAGAALSTQPVVKVQDQYGNVVTGATNAVTLTAYTDACSTATAGGTLGATTNPLSATAGVATFAAVSYTKAESIRLKAASGTLTSDCSSAIAVSHATGAKLAFSRQPSTTGTAGTDLAQQPKVQVLDAYNNLVSNATDVIAIAAYTDACSSATGAGTLSSGSATASSGEATFSGVDYTKAETIRLKATSGSLTSACSDGVAVGHSTGTKLSFSQQPSTTGTAGTDLSTQPRVQVLDAHDNLVSNATDVIAIAAYTDACSSATGAGTLSSGSATASSGLATFSGVDYTKAETIRLKATSGTLTAACSDGVAVSYASASKLEFSQQPSSTGTAGTDLSTQPKVRVLDAYDNLVANSTLTIALAAYTDTCSSATGGGTLNGASIAASSGVATFTGVDYTKVESVRLLASSGSLTTACSNAVAVSHGAAAQLSFETQPSTTLAAGDTLAQQPRVEVKDAHGNRVTGTNHSITLSGAIGSTCAIGLKKPIAVTSASVTSSSGLAQFAGVGTTVAGTIYLKASGTGMTSGCSSAITVSPGSPYKLGFTMQPVNAVQGLEMPGQPSVAILDQYGNRATGVSDTITLTAHSDSGCTSAASGTFGLAANGVATSSGVADFSGATYNQVERIYLKASGVSGYAEVCSMPIHVTPGMIAAGEAYSCHLNTSGVIKCWGYNANYQLGNNSSSSKSSPTEVSGISNAISVAVANTHSCAILSDHKVKCWGLNSSGQSGTGSIADTSSEVPLEVTGITTAMDLTVGQAHSCALLRDGTVRCWGNNKYGVLGDAVGAGATGTSNPTPLVVTGLTDAIAIDSGTTSNHNCVLLRDGYVQCWGDGQSAQLGHGVATESNVPVTVTGITTAQRLNSSYHNTCAMLADGTNRCWGYGVYFQNGNNLTASQASPVTATVATGAIDFAIGLGTSCVTYADFSAKCWGRNSFGQLGNGSYTPTSVSGPAAVTGLSDAAAMAVGVMHTCALLRTGAVECTGKREDGRLGDGTLPQTSVPIEVTGVSDLIDVAAGYQHTCFIGTDKLVRCMGYASSSVIGNSTGNATIYQVPQQATGLSSVEQISAGTSHNCARVTGGGMKCWGLGTNGRIGDGVVVTRNAPTSVTGIADATHVTAGGAHSCAVRPDGSIWCWGSGAQGRLGDGLSTDSYVPIQVSGISSGATHVEATSATSCAVVSGEVKCWGQNIYYQTGDGTTVSGVQTTVPTPVTVTGITTATMVAVATNASCALLSGGTIKCWGYDGNGELGDGASNSGPTAVPVTVTGISSATKIMGGNNHFCALEGSEIWCWGHNQYGKLGTGSTAGSSGAPVKVSGITTAVSISTGDDHACAVLSDGSARCWGSNTWGQVGDADAPYYTTLGPIAP